MVPIVILHLHTCVLIFLFWCQFCRECATLMATLHSKAGEGNLTVVHKKYSGPKFGSVAKLAHAASLCPIRAAPSSWWADVYFRFFVPQWLSWGTSTPYPSDILKESLSTDSKLRIHFGAAESKLRAASAQHDVKGVSSLRNVLAIEMHLVTLSNYFQILSSNLRRMITTVGASLPLPGLRNCSPSL